MVEAPDGNARRAAIVDAAAQVFLRYGFKKTSMDDLARAAREIAPALSITVAPVPADALECGWRASTTNRIVVAGSIFLLGDVLLAGTNPATKQLIDVYQATGIGAIAVEEVPHERTHLYGIVDGESAPLAPFGERLLRVRDLVEKPKQEDAPSNLAITGRYVLPPAIFECLERTKPGTGGEIQLTDGMRLLAKEQGLWAYIYEGISYDAGEKLGFLKATVELALKNAELGTPFREYLKTLKL